MRDITIRYAMNGYKVQVGCSELVFQDRTVMLMELARYLENPQGVEEEYLKKFGFGSMAGGAGVAPGRAETAYAANQASEVPRDHRRDRELRLGLDTTQAPSNRPG